jgi:hypothetical protein
MRAANGVLVRTPDRIRLGQGSHSSPANGACVVELASLFAGEQFSDRPQCVCPVIAAFLRGWNDRSAYADRQRLRPYAQRIVGTRASPSVTAWRRDLCLAWTGAELGGGPLRRRWRRLAIRGRIAARCGLGHALRLDEGAAEYAARVLYGRRDVEAAFGLLDALLAATGNGVVHVGAVAPARVPSGPLLAGRDLLHVGDLVAGDEEVQLGAVGAEAREELTA